MRFQRVVAAAFDADVALARVKRCSESSGSDHSPESSPDLSDLVKSFMENNERAAAGEEGESEEVGVAVPVRDDEDDHIHVKGGDEEEQGEKCEECSDSEKREMLQGLFAGNNEGGEDENERDDKETIRGEVELLLACGNNSMPGFKRRLMSRLREKGFDAGE